MPDITMCDNHACNLRENCYRFMATPSEYQSYSVFQPLNGECDFHWPIESKSMFKRLEVLTHG